MDGLPKLVPVHLVYIGVPGGAVLAEECSSGVSGALNSLHHNPGEYVFGVLVGCTELDKEAAAGAYPDVADHLNCKSDQPTAEQVFALSSPLLVQQP